MTYDHTMNATGAMPDRGDCGCDACKARIIDEDKRDAHQKYVEDLWDRLRAVGGMQACNDAAEQAGLGEGSAIGFAWGCLDREELQSLRVALRLRLMDY